MAYPQVVLRWSGVASSEVEGLDVDAQPTPFEVAEHTGSNRRGDPSSIGVENVHIQALGIIGTYLNWKDNPLPFILEPTAGRAWSRFRYRCVVRADGCVQIVDMQKE